MLLFPPPFHLNLCLLPDLFDFCNKVGPRLLFGAAASSGTPENAPEALQHLIKTVQP